MSLNLLQEGFYIQVFCKYGLVEEGIIQKYDESSLVLTRKDTSKSIILNPLENIINIRVFGRLVPASDEKKARVVDKPNPVYVDKELSPNHHHKTESLRAKELAELYTLKRQEERQRAKELLTSQKCRTPEVQFGYPNFTKPLFKHPQKKTR